MNIEISEIIPNKKFRQFHEILCNNNGRYIFPPLELWGTWQIRYGFDENKDYNNFNRQYHLVTTPVQEIRKDQKWRKLFRRIKLFFKIRK